MNIAHWTRSAITDWLGDLTSEASRGLCKVAASYLHYELVRAGYRPRLVQRVVLATTRT
jgi:hypothetical protein